MKLLQLNTEAKINKINFLPFNRKYGVRNDLIDKMNTYGFTVPMLLIETDIIDGTKSLWNADGQHRMATALYLGITPIAVVKTSEELGLKTIEDIVLYVASLNSSSKAWSILNYVESYNYLNYSEYSKLIKLANKSPYSVNTVASLLSGFRSRGTSSLKIKDGKFIALHYDETVATLNYAAELSKYEKLSSRMVTALHYVHSLTSFNKESFTKNYIDKCKQIKEMKLDDYTDVFTSWIK